MTETTVEETTDQQQDEGQDEEQQGKIDPFLRGKFALYWTPDGRNVHLRVLVDGFPPFEQDMPFAMVQRFIGVDSPAAMMAQIQEISEETAGQEQQDQEG